jgi:hypothetical protein
LLEESKQLAAEHAAEYADWKEEASSSGCNPVGVIEGQSAGGNETVQMRMMLKVLTPRMENSEHADARTEVAWISYLPKERGPSWLG